MNRQVTAFWMGYVRGVLIAYAIGLPILVVLLLSGCAAPAVQPVNVPFSDVTVKLDKGQFDHLMGTTPETPAVIHSEPTPAFRIEGPAEAAVGELVELVARGDSQGWAWHSYGGHRFATADGNSRLFFSTAKPGSYEFALGAFDGKAPVIVSHKLIIGGVPPQPTPEPEPQPTPIPVPPPQPSPIRVLVIEETLDRTKEQLKPWVRGGVIPPPLEVVDYLNAHCAKNDRGLPEWRWLDDDADLRNENQKWRDAMALPRASLPWIVICNGTACESVPLPQTKAELLALLRKWGG